MELERAGGRGTQGASGALAAHDRIANRPFPPVVSRTDGGDRVTLAELFSRERCGVHRRSIHDESRPLSPGLRWMSAPSGRVAGKGRETLVQRVVVASGVGS